MDTETQALMTARCEVERLHKLHREARTAVSRAIDNLRSEFSPISAVANAKLHCQAQQQIRAATRGRVDSRNKPGDFVRKRMVTGNRRGAYPPSYRGRRLPSEL